ncbi:MAG: cysteine rich repeat-containing protein [Burkholderiales bacterium]
MKRIVVPPLLVIVGLLTMSVAQADDREMRGACRADMKKHCKDVQPGGGRLAMCLKQHKSELSPGCGERIAETKKDRKELSEACKADAENVCKGVERGHGRIMRCLTENKEKLTSACQAEISQVQSDHPCMKDVECLCKGVQHGEGRIMECMKQHEAELSPECKAHHAERMGGEKK